MGAVFAKDRYLVDGLCDAEGFKPSLNLPERVCLPLIGQAVATDCRLFDKSFNAGRAVSFDFIKFARERQEPNN